MADAVDSPEVPYRTTVSSELGQRYAQASTNRNIASILGTPSSTTLAGTPIRKKSWTIS